MTAKTQKHTTLNLHILSILVLLVGLIIPASAWAGGPALRILDH